MTDNYIINVIFMFSDETIM